MYEHTIHIHCLRKGINFVSFSKSKNFGVEEAGGETQRVITMCMNVNLKFMYIAITCLRLCTSGCCRGRKDYKNVIMPTKNFSSLQLRCSAKLIHFFTLAQHNFSPSYEGEEAKSEMNEKAAGCMRNDF